MTPPTRADGPVTQDAKRQGGAQTSKVPLPLAWNAVTLDAAAKNDVDAATISPNICFFHARGPNCPNKEQRSRFSHSDEDIWVLRVDHNPDPDQAIIQILTEMIVTYRLVDVSHTSYNDSETI